MLTEIEKGNIGTIIVKDMSRLGRNYVQMGMLREQLRRAKVVCLAAAKREKDNFHSQAALATL